MRPAIYESNTDVLNKYKVGKAYIFACRRGLCKHRPAFICVLYWLASIVQ